MDELNNHNHLGNNQDNKYSEQELLERVKTILSELLNADINEIDANTNIRNDIGADSLDMVEISMEIEKHFFVLIPDEKMEAIITIQDIVNNIQQLLNEKLN